MQAQGWRCSLVVAEPFHSQVKTVHPLHVGILSLYSPTRIPYMLAYSASTPLPALSCLLPKDPVLGLPAHPSIWQM